MLTTRILNLCWTTSLHPWVAHLPPEAPEMRHCQISGEMVNGLHIRIGNPMTCVNTKNIVLNYLGYSSMCMMLSALNISLGPKAREEIAEISPYHSLRPSQ